MKLLIVFIFCVMISVNLCSKTPVRSIDSLFFASKIDSLEQEFGQNKIIPEKYKLQILIALSYYPELKNEQIYFRTQKITTTMSSIPSVFSIFSKKEKRKYIISINNKLKFRGILIDDVPFNAQIGVFGHELAHVVDYNSRNLFGIFKRGFDYLTSKSKAKFEKFIDETTIKYGFGWQLYDWSNFSLYKSKATQKYIEFKKKIYLEPQEIKEIINKLDMYESVKE